jgi:hypothetical protein
MVLWDWLSKMGLGGLIVWLIQRWIGKRDKAVDRGRQLVDDARPELVPINNLGDRNTVALNVVNRGKGTARTLRLTFTGVQEIETRDEVPVGQQRTTARLNVQGSPFFTQGRDGRAEITLVYADRYRSEYRLILPVTRQPRADGGFNPAFDFTNYRHVEPKLTKRTLREIGAI